MKLGISGKLFLAILSSCLVVAICMGWVVRHRFHHDFLQYVRQSNEARVTMVAGTLSRVYGEHGDWSFIHGPTDGWYDFLRELGQVGEPDPADDMGTDRPPRPVTPPPGLRSKLWLVDMDGRLIGGRDPIAPDALRRPVVAMGKTVGWLISSPPDRLTRTADVHFADQQIRNFWIVACLAAAVAALVTMVLSRGFLRRLKHLAASTHDLAIGDFSARVPEGAGDEIGRLAQDFNQLARTLDRNEQNRRQFMADVSHELRTPLTVLRGELEAIEDGVRQVTPLTLRSLQAEVATLTKLVNDLYLLSLSDVGGLAYRKGETDLADLVATAQAAFTDRLSEKGIACHLDLPAPGLAMVLGDMDRLTQLFNNILENAVRYTDGPGQMTISVTVNGEQVRVCFDDSPPGLPSVTLARIFDRFYRGEESRNRASGGSGLGLAICKNIVSAHDGRIEAQNSPLGGLRLIISIPCLSERG